MIQDKILRKTLINKEFLLYSIMWGTVCLFQAWWTPIHADEAYYWCFSENLDWGYFDHPPIAPLMIKISSWLFPGILGLRGLTIFTQIISLYLLFKLIENKEGSNFNKVSAFWILVFCLPLFHIYGFITTPDVPLFLFGVLFFFFYKKILLTNNILVYFMWGLSMGLMLMSKYHGALLIVFVILSNPKLLLNPRTYFAGIVGLLIGSPHIYWQYQNDWITFKYHLVERVNNPKWFYPLEFIGNTILIFNPFLIRFIIKLTAKKWSNVFERGLYFVFLGFILFFGSQTLRDHIQPQWLILAYIPFVVLTLNHLEEKQYKNLKKLFFISLPFLILIHIILSFNLLPNDLDIFGKKRVLDEINKEAKGKPIVFINSYQGASLYNWYFKGNYAHSYSIVSSRKSQYNIWMKDAVYNNLIVYAPGKLGKKMQDKSNQKLNGSFNNYLSYDKVKIKSLEESFNIDGRFVVTIKNPYSSPLIFSEKGLNIFLVLFKQKKPFAHISCQSIDNFFLNGNMTDNLILNFGDVSKFEAEAEAYGFAIAKPPWPVGSVFFTNPIND